MSHFATLVLVDRPITREQAEDAVTPLLAPYDENGQWFRENSRWDWWMIGGRWTGSLSGYDPEEDPVNVETCIICGGTGERPGGREQFGDEWYEATHGCNGCNGKGTHVAWPTQWLNHDGDVMPLRFIREDFVPYAIVTPDGRWQEKSRMGWFGCAIPDEDGNEEKDAKLWQAVVVALKEQYPDAYAVVVDCHV